MLWGIIGKRGRYGANIVALGDIWVSAVTGDKTVDVQNREETILGMDLV